MTRKSNAKNTLVGVEQGDLDDIFSSPHDNLLVSLSEPVCVAIGRCVVSITALGGMATLYRGGNDNSLCLSLRLGERKRGIYFGPDPDQATGLEQLANAFEAAYAKKFLASKNP